MCSHFSGIKGRGVVEVAERQLEMQEAELGGVRNVLEEEHRPSAEPIVYHEIVTRSPLMHELFDVMERIKDTELSTVITGETGTGKELIARAIHFGGNRSSFPFEAVGCGSLSMSLLESELFGYRKGAFSGADKERAGIFERAIERSYEQSLDCPELSELRTVQDALAGHRAAGTFDASLWWVSRSAR